MIPGQIPNRYIVDVDASGAIATYDLVKYTAPPTGSIGSTGSIRIIPLQIMANNSVPAYYMGIDFVGRNDTQDIYNLILYLLGANNTP